MTQRQRSRADLGLIGVHARRANSGRARQHLHRYWIHFAGPPSSADCFFGVTAYSVEDALRLVKSRAFAESDMSEIIDVVEDVDVSTLDPGHVVPNILPPVWRGIWYPTNPLS